MKPAPVVAKKEKNALAMKIAPVVAKKERNAPVVVKMVKNAPVVVDVKTVMQKTLALVVVKMMANAHAKKTVAK